MAEFIETIKSDSKFQNGITQLLKDTTKNHNQHNQE